MNISRLWQSVLVGALLPVAGCASLADWKYEKTQLHRARAAYKACGNPCGECYPKDYRSGWLDGYYDGLTGGGCCPPAIAPARYWDPDQILNDCDNRRHAYYSGWQDGAASAARCPDTHYLKVHETCDCPMPRCQNGCSDERPCGCQQPCGCNDALGLQDSGQMIEILSDVPIGTTLGYEDHSPGPEPTYGEPATDQEVDHEFVPDAPVDHGAADDLPELTGDSGMIRAVGFTSPASAQVTSPRMPASKTITPGELFGSFN